MAENEAPRFGRLEEPDLDAVVEIEKAVFATPWSRALFAEELKNPGVCRWFKLSDPATGALLAYMGYWRAVDEAHITNLAVLPSRQRGGLGRRLVGELLAEAAREGCVRATLEVRPSNQAALALYGAFGFIPVALRRKYYVDNDEDAVVMIKEGL